jgi:Tetratricopeptide repeat
LNNLAVLRFDQERYQESIDLQLESIRVWETALGKENPSLVAPLNGLATTYLKMARFDDAAPLPGCRAASRATSTTSSCEQWGA